VWAVAAKAKTSSTLPLLSPLLCAHAPSSVSTQLATSTANAALAIRDTLNEVCAASELDILLVEARLDCTDAFAHVRAAVIGANGTLARAAASGAAAGIEQFASATSSSKSLSASSSSSALRRQNSNVADAASSASTTAQAGPGSGPAALVRRESSLTMRLSKSKFLKSNLSGRLLGGGTGNRHAIAEEDEDDDVDEDGGSARSAAKSRNASQRIAVSAMPSSKKLTSATTGSRANVRQGSITALLALANEADLATGGGGGIGGGGSAGAVGSAGGSVRGGARRWAPDRPDVLKAMTDESLAAVAECHAVMMGTNGEAAGSSNLLVWWQYYDSIVSMIIS
jgi:hypothetical protein